MVEMQIYTNVILLLFIYFFKAWEAADWVLYQF